MDYLMREDAPLTDSEWDALDGIVNAVARQLLVARRFVSLAGPYGIGAEVVPLDAIGGAEACVHGDEACACESGECDIVRVTSRTFLSVPLLHQDFMLGWRELEAARQSGRSMEYGPAATSAASIALAEDKMVFDQLLSADGHQSTALGDWETSGGALNAVSAARGALAGGGFIGPYALIVSPSGYGLLQRPYGHSGRLEIQLVESVADGGILQTPALDAGQALLVAHGSQYLDLAVAQDLVTAYLGPEGMDHRFRVLESLVLRIKQPGAICVLQ
jgi:uncharacterized linocin/CFP29 family protein